MSQYDAVTDDIYNFFSEEFDFSNDLLIDVDDNKEDSDVSEDLTVSSGEQSLKTAQLQQSTTTVTTSTTIIQTTQQKSKPKTIRKYSDLLKEDEMLKAQNLYERLISDQIERDKKFTKGEAGIARPITGHVRSVYAQMFMNSINSADLNNIQNYLGTFMSGPCSFTLNHRVNGMYELPASLTAFSPQLFSHYLLGCFLSFPDMVVKMNGSRMYNASNGHTKIVIDTDVLCTKMFEVKFDWAPDVEQLSDVYSNMRITNRSTNTSSSQVKDDNTSGINTTTTTTTTTKNKNESSSSTAVNKEDEGSIQGVVAATPTNLAAVRRLPAIPMTYVTGMSQQAKMLSAPVPLHTRGTIILYLDSNNCMQHLHVDVTQLDRLPTTDSSTTAPATNYTATASNNNMPPPVSASPPQKQRKAPVKRATKPKQQQPPTLSTGISSGISGSGNNNNSNDNNNSGIVMTGSNSA